MLLTQKHCIGVTINQYPEHQMHFKTIDGRFIWENSNESCYHQSMKSFSSIILHENGFPVPERLYGQEIRMHFAPDI